MVAINAAAALLPLNTSLPSYLSTALPAEHFLCARILIALLSSYPSCAGLSIHVFTLLPLVENRLMRWFRQLRAPSHTGQ